MRPTNPIVKTVLAAVVFACLFFATSCVTAPDGTRSSSIVMSFTVADASGHATALARTDLNTTVVFGAGSASGELFQKPSPTMPAGFPIYGPVSVSAGKVYVFDRAADMKLTLSIGEPLPARCRVLFRPGEAEALGLTFEAPVAPPASP